MRGTRRWRSSFMIRFSLEELSREGRPSPEHSFRLSCPMRGTRHWRSSFMIRYSLEELSHEGRSSPEHLFRLMRPSVEELPHERHPSLEEQRQGSLNRLMSW